MYEIRGGEHMDALTVLIVVSLLIFDLACLLFIRNQFVAHLDRLVDKVIKIIED